MMMMTTVILALCWIGCGASDDAGVAWLPASDAADIVGAEDGPPGPPLDTPRSTADHGEPDVPLVEGGFGWPCNANDACTSEWCVESAEGQVCTKTCIDSCPTGWECKPIANVGQDVTYICVDPFARLCWPCAADPDCQSPTAAPGARCVNTGDAGSFCATDCSDQSCPPGHSCTGVALDGGTEVQVCAPDSGDCACSGLATSLKLSTVCGWTNESGVCAGTRTCEASGLSACDAAEPAVEVCDGEDNDCDGAVDGPSSADCVTWFGDTDGDGYGIGVGECLCESPGDGFSTDGGDCNDLDTGVSPGVDEICNFVDDDCDSDVDEDGALGCTSYFPDEDGDGFGGVALEQCTCGVPVDGYILKGGDCDDTTVEIGPGAKEVCDGVDNDCDGDTDEENAKGCTVYYLDKDGDGYGQTVQLKCLCEPDEAYSTPKGGDCNDTDDAVHPLAVEICNDLDDDCDGEADQDGTVGCGVFYKDGDEDTFGDPDDAKCFCTPKYPYTVQNAEDCDDGSALAIPGGTEVCDGIDNDCDGGIDNGVLAGCTEYYFDGDEDGFGTGSAECLCAPDGLLKATVGGDCNDADPTAYPGGQETCAPADENCNGQVNESGALGCTVFHKDEDNDGWGVDENKCTCGDVAPYTASKAGDCYDANSQVFPGQTGWYSAHRGDGSFDYNCDGDSTRKDLNLGKCGGAPGCSTTKGWRSGSIPNCGITAQWVHDCDSKVFSCDKESDALTQQCH